MTLLLLLMLVARWVREAADAGTKGMREADAAGSQMDEKSANAGNQMRDRLLMLVSRSVREAADSCTRCGTVCSLVFASERETSVWAKLAVATELKWDEVARGGGLARDGDKLM